MTKPIVLEMNERKLQMTFRQIRVAALFLILAFCLSCPAFAGGGVTVHTSDLAGKMKPEEIEWMTKEVERVYPDALARVIAFVGTDKVKKAFTDFHVLVREISLNNSYIGWSRSYARRGTNPSYKRQAITLCAPHFFAGAAHLENTIVHEMIHVAYEYGVGSREYASWPMYLVEGMTYYGAGEMDSYVNSMLNRFKPIYEASQVVRTGSKDRIWYLTFIYCFEREYGLEARKDLLLKLQKGAPYKKTFEAITGDDWKKVKRKCKRQLTEYINEKLATANDYLPIYEAYDDAIAIEDYQKPLQMAYAFLEANPDTIWKDNLYQIIGSSYKALYQYDKAIELYEKLRNGELTRNFGSYYPAFEILRNTALKLECKKAEALLAEYSRLYPVYSKQWKKGAKNVVDANCSRREGDVEGLRRYFYENKNRRSEGAFKDNKRLGKWTYWHPNAAKRSEGEYVAGNKHGPWTYWHENGQKAKEGNWVHGKKEGTFAQWHNNGQLEVEAGYVNGFAEGFWTYFFEDGKKAKEGAWKKSHKEGPWTHWDKGGKKESEGDYVEGSRTNKWTFWFDDGTKKSEGYFVYVNHRTKKEGFWSFWHFNGQIKSNGEYRRGKKVGHWVFRHDNGKKSSEGEYLGGKKTGTWKYFYKTETLKEETEYIEGDKVDKK
jgi:antitoxin component YwqK of YwqJK toxin-antitoxin module